MAFAAPADPAEQVHVQDTQVQIPRQGQNACWTLHHQGLVADQRRAGPRKAEMQRRGGGAIVIIASIFGREPLTYEETELAPNVLGRTLTPDDALRFRDAVPRHRRVDGVRVTKA